MSESVHACTDVFLQKTELDYILQTSEENAVNAVGYAKLLIMMHDVVKTKN